MLYQYLKLEQKLGMSDLLLMLQLYLLLLRIQRVLILGALRLLVQTLLQQLRHQAVQM
jgi:hypothetical protein